MDVSGSDKDDAMSCYARKMINISKGFLPVPEYGVVDNSDNAAGDGQGMDSCFGTQWQMNF